MDPATCPSTEEKSNYAKLCRFLVDVGPQVLRGIFDEECKECPSGNLNAVLNDPENYAKLQTLRKKRVLSTSQWCRLYPYNQSSVSSKDFDSSLLLLLLTNIFDVNLPASPCLFPSRRDRSPRAHITRIKFLRNRVYSHAADASVSDELFKSYQTEIKDTFSLIGGSCSKYANIDFKRDCMDVDVEEHYKELFREWMKDDDCITDKSHEDKTIKKTRKEEDMDGSTDISKKESGMEEVGMMPVGNRPAYNSNANPPELKFKLVKKRNLPSISKDLSKIELPVDILLFTVEDCEFLSCFAYLEEPFRGHHNSIGFVYFGCMGNDQGKKMKIALMRCSKGSGSLGGSLSAAKGAIRLLKPKATISVGACSGLDNGKVKLGDVVISSQLITATYRTPPSSSFIKLIKGMADGWKAPLQNADEYVKVHCDGVVVSVSEANKHIISRHPDAFAVETEGEGLFTACFDLKTEWLAVRGIKDIRGKNQFSNEEWEEFASVMAASVVAHLLRDLIIFQDWPHFNAD